MSGFTSGSGGSSGTSAPGVTFAQPGSPTQGLQNYNLEGSVKNLVPDTAATGAKPDWRKKLAAIRAGRGDQSKRGSARTTSGKAANLKKAHPMFNTKLEGMIAALAQSVAGIHTAGGDDRESLLTKSFNEFRDALLAEHDADLAKAVSPGPDALFKNAGVPGQIGSLVADLDRRLELLKSAGGIDPEIELFLEMSRDNAEIALNKAVNAECEVAEADELQKNAPAGSIFIEVPVEGGAEGETVILKTALPEDLAKMAVDPATLDNRVAELAVLQLQTLGVPEGRIEQLFKADPMPPAKKPKSQPAPDSPDAGAIAQGDDNGAGAGGDQTGSAEQVGDPDGGMDPSGDDPLTVLQRILAAAMIQVQHIVELVEGSADTGTTDDQDAGNGDVGGTPNPPPSGTGMGKAAPAARLTKNAPAAAPAVDPRVDGLLKAVGDLTKGQEEIAKTVALVGEGMTKVLALPLPAKGVSNTGMIPGAIPDGQPSDEDLLKAFRNMAPEERAHIELLAAFKAGPEPRFTR